MTSNVPARIDPDPDVFGPIALACFNAMPFAALVFDRDCRLVCTNQRYRDLTGVLLKPGISYQEAMASAPVYFGTVPHPGNTLTLESALEGNSHFIDGFDMTTSAGRVPCDAWIEPVRSGGSVHHAMILIRKRFVEDAVRADVQEALHDQAAADAEKQRLEISGSVSHELRSPLTALIGFADLLSRTEGLSEEARDKVRYIQRSGNHLLRVVTQMIQAARSRVLARETASVRIMDELGWLRDTFSDQARLKGLRFRITVDPNIPTRIFCDQTRLRQCLVNLTGNAIKMTDAGTVTVRAITTSTRNRIRLEVRDSGVGIPRAEQKQLFRNHSQGAEGQRRGGLGIGLTIVKQYIEEMDGSVSVRSTEGKGTVFALEIPTDRRSRSSADPEPGVPQAGPNEAALQEMRQLPKEYRRQLGTWAVECEHDGIEELAAELVETCPETAAFLREVVESCQYERISDTLKALETAG